MQEIAIHTMDFINAATTGILSPHVLPFQDRKQMLKHIEETLPSTLHMPISSDGTLHFYRYLCTYILIIDDQLLLMINVLIQDHTEQIEVSEVCNLDRPHGNYSLQYDIENKHLGITHDETNTIKILQDQFQTCQKANRNFVY